MSLRADQQSDEPVAPTRRAPGTRRAPYRLCRAGLVFVAFLGTGVLAAACGGGPSASAVAGLGTTTTSVGPSAANGGSTTTPSDSALAFVNCMRTHGEPNMPDPVMEGHSVHIVVTPGLDPSSQRFTAADNACRHLLPNNGVSRDTITAADQADYLKAAACMRSHGAPNFPDPTFENGSVTFNVRTPIDTSSSEYKSALATCQKLIPAGLPYSSSSAS
ncbi:MAG TPA: hypothetical protein VME20_01210 [Acidimicrobiales bacterium]|nr:hypothetical protein [Acidimicrobiales bacterium]